MTDYDVIVIGGGSSGEHAAGALAEGGLRVALVERELARGDGSRGIDLLRGTGRLAGPCAVEVDGVDYTTEHVVLATGAEPIIPPIRGLRELDGVWTSPEATALEAVPRRLLVLGGGRVGVELSQAVRRLGGEVVLIERSTRVTAARREGEDYVLELEDGRELRGDRLVVAAGRRPRVKGIGLETLRMVPDARGIPVDGHMRAGDRLWAIGSVTGRWSPINAGEYQAGIAAANILGDPREADYDAEIATAQRPPEVAS